VVDFAQAVSTRRAMKGAAAMVSGTMAAAVPMEVPTKKARHRDHRHQQDDEGRRAHRIDQQAGDAVEGALGSTPLDSVMCRAMPSGMPSSEPTTPEITTIISVSPKELTNRSISSDDMVELLDDDALLAQVLHGLVDVVLGAVGEDRQRAEAWPWISSIWPCRMLKFRLKRRTASDRCGWSTSLPVKAKRNRWSVPWPVGTRQALAQAGQHALGQLVGDDVADQRAGDFMARLAEHVQHFALFDHLAGFHHGHAVADLLDDFHLVRDQHDGQAQFLVDLAQQFEDGAGGFGSSAEVASSESRTLGSLARARAMPTRCFWPPEICAG
jgi:hypothetical protein